MINYRRLLSLLAVTYGAVFVIIIAFSDSGSSVRSDSLFNMPSPLYMAQEVDHHLEPLEKKAFLRHFQDLDIDQTTQLELKSAINAAIALQNAPKPNPFALLGGYSDVDLSRYFTTLAYDTPHYSLINEDDYCDKVDLYNLEHPENMFEKMNFYTDAPRTSVLKSRVVSKIGTPFMSHIDVSIPFNVSNTRTTKIPKEITTFHIMTYLFLKHHQMGKHFLCATQMFNHILNATDLIYKTQIIQRVQEYSLMYKDKPQCFNKDTFTPPSYRLYVKSECEEFFRIINSEQYKESLKTEPIQYIIKLGRDTHRATGVFLLDTNKTQSIHTEYDSGRKCGQVKEVYMAQKYISNPLLLDNSNKFHMRVYLLIASVNPFIVYFQDGYIRASIFPFDKFSDDRATHLTNLLAGDFVEARKQNKTLYGMTPQELDDYQIWTLERLQNYLLQSGKITDTNWLDNYLRPAIQKSFMHLIRMTGGNFWKQSNMFELFGCDFMMDDDLNVYFIEANFNPQLDVSNPNIVAKMLEDLYEVQYAIYRSRMKRVIDVINRMKEATANEPVQDLSKWKELYQEASKNKLEPEFKLKETNTFRLVMDESLPGAQAYLGNLPEECL